MIRDKQVMLYSKERTLIIVKINDFTKKMKLNETNCKIPNNFLDIIHNFGFMHGTYSSHILEWPKN